jgi:hypothetical protein
VPVVARLREGVWASGLRVHFRPERALAPAADLAPRVPPNQPVWPSATVRPQEGLRRSSR